MGVVLWPAYVVILITAKEKLVDAAHYETALGSAMESTNSPKVEQDTSKPHNQLRPSEIESLKQEMIESGEWMTQELKRRQQEKIT